MFFVIRQQRYRSSSAAVGARFIVPAYTYTPTKWRTEMRVRWNENTNFMKRICVFDNVRIRARWIGPYAWRGVRNQFRGCSQHYRNPFAAFWQTTSSCRGRFIAPAYMKTPTKWGKKMRVWWNECVYLIMWICVFNETDTRFLFMSGYGRDESAPTPNGLFATHFVGVCGYFTDCLLAFCVMFATHSQSVQNTFT